MIVIKIQKSKRSLKIQPRKWIIKFQVFNRMKIWFWELKNLQDLLRSRWKLKLSNSWQKIKKLRLRLKHSHKCMRQPPRWKLHPDRAKEDPQEIHKFTSLEAHKKVRKCKHSNRIWTSNWSISKRQLLMRVLIIVLRKCNFLRTIRELWTFQLKRARNRWSSRSSLIEDRLVDDQIALWVTHTALGLKLKTEIIVRFAAKNVYSGKSNNRSHHWTNRAPTHLMPQSSRVNSHSLKTTVNKLSYLK